MALQQNGSNKDSTDCLPHLENEELSTQNVAPIHIDRVKEEAVLRKFDWLVLPQFFIIMVLSYLDRSNIGMSLNKRNAMYFSCVFLTWF